MAQQISKSEELNLLNQATEFGKKREFDHAIETLKTLISHSPNHELALGMLASIYAEIGLYDRAIENFEKALDLNADNPLVRFQLGLIQFKNGDPQQALDTWAPALNQNDFMLHFHSGLALRELNRIDEARQMFAQANKTMPSNHALHAQLQEIRESLGDV